MTREGSGAIMKKIIFGFTDDFRLPDAAWKQLKENFQDSYHFYTMDESTAEDLSCAEAYVGWPSDQTLDQMRSLRWIQLPSAGANHFTKNPKIAPDVIVTNSKGVYNVSGSEHILALVLAFTRQIPQYARQTANHEWRMLEGVRQVEGTTATIIGLGNIGRAAAKRLHAFGAHVLGVKRSLGEIPEDIDQLFSIDNMTEALEKSDFVINILPLTEETADLFQKKVFDIFKPGSIFINVGRGQSVVEKDLINALRAGRLGGAALDVTAVEPLPPESPLWTFDNVLITSHSLGLSPGRLERHLSLLTKNLKKFAQGENLENVVDRELGY